jgi:putative hydrolase of the HAD superfamily
MTGTRAGTATLDAVLFDWGGTLTPWHTIDLREQWWHYTRVYDPDRADELAGQLLVAEDVAWGRARDHQRSGTLEDLLRSVGIEASGPTHEQALAAYHAFWEPHTLIDPDVPALLAALRERGLKIGVLSNTLWTRDHHEAVFRRDGVLDLIDGAVYTSEIEWTKPHPEAFRAAMASVGATDPSRVVFVGDRPYDDVHGAKEVGMRAVLVPHSAIPANQKGHVEGDPDAVVQRLADLLDVVDGWLAGAARG